MLGTWNAKETFMVTQPKVFRRKVTQLFVLLAAAAVVATASLAACTIICTTELRFAVYGAVIDSNGAAVVPTSVTSIVDGRSLDCSVNDNSYSCAERGGGTYTLRVEVGAFVEEQDFRIEADECHILEGFQHDVVVP